MGNQSNCQSSCQGLQKNIGQICKAKEENPSLKPISFEDTIAPFQTESQNKKSSKHNHQKYFQQQQIRNDQISSIDKISNSKQESTTLKKRQDENQKVYDCDSPQRKIQFKMEQMVLINAFSDQIKQTKIKYQPMNVPFSVIKMSLSKNVLQAIKQVDSSFFSKYQKDTKSFKLFKQGFYAQILNQNYGIFLNTNYFYQGELKFQKQRQIYYPQGKGLYINQVGKYYGYFENGRADKRGKLFQFTNKILYQGTWSKGKFINGKVQNNDFVYQGDIKQNKPNGKGKILFLRQKISYQGKFVEGKFSDLEGIYQCQQYIYKGGFQAGKKQGKGILQQKIKKSDIKNKVQSRLQTFEGSWSNDLFIESSKQSALRLKTK